MVFPRLNAEVDSLMLIFAEKNTIVAKTENEAARRKQVRGIFLSRPLEERTGRAAVLSFYGAYGRIIPRCFCVVRTHTGTWKWT